MVGSDVMHWCPWSLQPTSYHYKCVPTPSEIRSSCLISTLHCCQSLACDTSESNAPLTTEKGLRQTLMIWLHCIINDIKISLSQALTHGQRPMYLSSALGRGPDTVHVHPPPLKKNYIFLKPLDLLIKKIHVNLDNIGMHINFCLFFETILSRHVRRRTKLEIRGYGSLSAHNLSFLWPIFIIYISLESQQN